MEQYSELQEISTSRRRSFDRKCLADQQAQEISYLACRGVTMGQGITMITGPVGSGKSTILKALLRHQSGLLKIAYCAQDAWIRDGTIRDNIIGPSDFDSTWYDEVLALSQLKPDLAALPDRDMHLTGESGASLSGGQRQRVVCGNLMDIDMLKQTV